MALADDISVYEFAPEDPKELTITGKNNNLTGSFSVINKGADGYESTTLGVAWDNGWLGKNGDLVEEYNIFRIGTQNKAIDYIDPITGNKESMRVYDNANMSLSPLEDFHVVISVAVGPDGQYVDRNLYHIDTGSALDVNVGTQDADWVNSQDNRFAAIFKSSDKTQNNSSAFHVTSDGSDTAALNYHSKTVVQLGQNSNDYHNSVANAVIDRYTGSFDSVLGPQNVTTFEEFQAYNTALIEALESGEIHLTEQEYAAELNKARDTTVYPIYVNEAGISEDDAVRAVVNRDAVSYIHAEGENAVVTIDSDADIELYNSDASVVNLEDGARLVNNGTLGTANNTLTGAYIVNVNDNSTFENNGVLDAGTNPDMAKMDGQSAASVAWGTHIAVTADGDAEVHNSNTGVINLATSSSQYDNIGVMLSGNATLTNDGVINVASTAQAQTQNNPVTSGAIVSQNATFNNNGLIYIGREVQRTVDDAAADLAITGASAGVKITDNGVYNGSEDSQIIIGSKTTGAQAIVVSGNATMKQGGTIDINGAVTGASMAANQGIVVGAGTDRSQVENSGVINLNGLNAVGIYVTSGGEITHSGVINVNGGFDTDSRYANYGIRVEGEGALAEVSGKVNLFGDNTIGIQARNGGDIDLAGSGEVTFSDGKNQVGYFIYGAGSSVTGATSSVQDVSTQDSTLFRIDAGATFNGADFAATELNASGENSTIIRTTGAKSSFNSGDLTLNITGDGAVGVRIEGGASGTLSADADVTLSGQNSVAGIVDGNYYGLDGAINTKNNGDSTLTSYANLATGDDGNAVFGYIARNGGTLIHEGSINFAAANSTGVLVEDGALDNRSDIQVNGIAVNIQGEDSVAVNTGTVSATDGAAAWRVGDGATLALSGNGVTQAAGTAHGILLDDGAKGLTVDGATITMDAAGSGSAIENKANVSGIALNDTTINVGNGIGVHTGVSLAKTNSGEINVKGNGVGILFENIDGSTTDQTLDLSDSGELAINVQGAGGKGIVTNTSADLATAVDINVSSDSGGAALTIGGTTKNVGQSGTLTSSSTTSAVVNVTDSELDTFVNKGDILARDASATALEVNSGDGVTFTNASGAHIVGQVNLLSGDNTVILESGSTATDVTTGSGDDLFLLNDIGAQENALFTSLNGADGDDTLAMQNSVYTLNDADALTGIEHVTLTDASRLTLDQITLALGDEQNDAVGTDYSLDASSTLALNASDDLAFNSHLAGDGTLEVDTAGHTFDFTANNAADGFSGTVSLTNTLFELDGLNTQALGQATLSAGQGSITHVGAGEQSIGGLAFNGGTLSFDDVTPGKTQAAGIIHAGEMDLTGAGTVQVDTGVVSNDRPLPDTDVPVMEQDDAQLLIKLADSATPVTGSAGNLALTDSDGNVITDAVDIDISQNDVVVAQGHYDYRLTSGSQSDGLYVSYGLTQVDLLGSGDNALTLDASGKNGNAADLSAKITGTGDLAIDSQPDSTVTLSNQDNDYTGVTDVRSGALAMLNDNVLGNSSELRLAVDTGFDMNGHAQTVGEVNADAGSLIDLDGGSLTLLYGGTVNGELTGAGELTVAGDSLTIYGANDMLTANTVIANGASVLLDNTAGLGSGDITVAGELQLNSASGVLRNSLSDAGTVALNGSDVALSGDNRDFSGIFDIDADSQLRVSDATQLGTATVDDQGTLLLNSASDWTLANSVTGAGNLTKRGDGVITLTGDAQYTGVTEIEQGGLMLGSEQQSVMLTSRQVNIGDAATLSGFGGVSGDVDNQGLLQVSGADAIFTIGGDLVNHGAVSLGQKGMATGNQLVINGNYAGDGGHLYFNTVLGDDDSLTDKMIVKGDTSGSTDVSVTNAGGSGASTLNGIEIIHVDGQSDGAFVQSGRIAAGMYDYYLTRGEGDNSGNWYLSNSSDTPPAPDTDDDTPPTPDADGGDNTPVPDSDGGSDSHTDGSGDDSGTDVNPTPTPDATPNVRPEAGSYTANLAAANTMFITTLHDRLGETQYVDALTGEKKVTSLWLRQTGGHNRWHDNSGQLKTQSNRYTVQLGGDVAQWSEDGLDRWHLGLMAGYGRNDSSTEASRTGYHSDGSVDGYSAGVYATWYANNIDHTGAYLDSWVQYSWFNNDVQGEGIQSESYKSSGFTTSLELGYTWKLGETYSSRGSRHEWYLQPQAQAVWMGVKADDHREANGTRVSGEGDGNVQTRLGLRAYAKGHSDIDNGKGREFQPFVEVNWLHNTKDFGVQMDGVSIAQSGTRNLGEVKAGVEGQLSPNVNVWGNVGVRLGDDSYSDASAMLGIKYNF